MNGKEARMSIYAFYEGKSIRLWGRGIFDP